MDEVKKLLNQKENLILEIINQLMTWDDTVDHAMHLLAENDQNFNQLKEIDAGISEEELITFNGKYKEHWLRIINLQQELMKTVEDEKTHTQEQLAQIDQKQKVVSNYMTVKNKSIFVEKDY